jgi:hypothetical protein
MLRGVTGSQTRLFTVPLAAGDRMSVPVAALSGPATTLPVSVTHSGRTRPVVVRTRAVTVATVGPMAVSTSLRRGHSSATARVAIRTVVPGATAALTVTVSLRGRTIATTTVTCVRCRPRTLVATLPWKALRGTYRISTSFSVARPGNLAGVVTRGSSRAVSVT